MHIACRRGEVMLIYSKKLKPFARQLRTDMTPQERKVWRKIRNKQIHGIQFYRQKPIGPFIIDFFMLNALSWQLK